MHTVQRPKTANGLIVSQPLSIIA